MRELQTTLRGLRKSPGYAAAVIAILALAVGVNSVIFSATQAVVLRPFPVRHLEELVDVGRSDPTFGAHYGLNPAELFDLERRHDLFAAIGGYRSVDANLTGSGDPQRVAAVVTSNGFFPVFGIRAYLGRLYDAGDDQLGATNVVVLSYEFWRAFTGSDRAAIGRTVHINDSSFTILGVLPPHFAFPAGTQLWTLRPIDHMLDRHAPRTTQYPGALVPTIARMRPGMTLPVLSRALTATMHEWERQSPDIYAHRIPQPIEARSLGVTWAGSLRPILFALIGAVALVLLIACANIASLQLLRATGRAREVALRLALGASSWDVLRLFAIESSLLAAVGGVLGVVLCQCLVDTVGRSAATVIPELYDLRVDSRVLIWSAGITTAAALLFGIGPALSAMRNNARDVLNATASRSSSAGRGRIGLLHITIVVQVAVSLMLVLACGVAVRSLIGLLHVNPGFNAADVLTARIMLPPSRYEVKDVETARRVVVLHNELLDRVRHVPGFDIVGAVDVPPFGYRGTLDAAVHGLAVWTGPIAGAGQRTVPANRWFADPDYFRALQIPVLKGAGFTGAEYSNFLRDYPHSGEFPVLIDDVLARRLFGDADPIGKVLDASAFRVIGVVRAVKKTDLTSISDDAGAIYVPSVVIANGITLVIRTGLSTREATARLRAAVRDFDPLLPLFDVAPLSDIVDKSAGARRLAVWMLASLAALSLLLAVFGIYAVVSYATTQRTKEIGIRMALGASPNEIIAMVTRSSAGLTGIGLVLGVFGYLVCERGLSTLAYGVSPNDPRMLVVAAGVLAAAALVASVPAIVRATRVNPVEALRLD